MAFITIKTLYSSYKCHDYRMKNSRVYFNGRAVNVGNVVSITLKDETIAYKNDSLSVVKPKRAQTVATQKRVTPKSTRVPDVIEI